MLKAVLIVIVCNIGLPPMCLKLDKELSADVRTDAKCSAAIEGVFQPVLDTLEQRTSLKWYIRSGQCRSERET